jgi:hypothetical protein
MEGWRTVREVTSRSVPPEGYGDHSASIRTTGQQLAISSADRRAPLVRASASPLRRCPGDYAGGWGPRRAVGMGE